MKNRFSLTVFALALLLGMIPNLLKALDAGVSYAVYATPDKPYVEINIEIDALTIKFKQIDSLNVQASADVLILIKKGDQVVNFEKYNLNSPLVKSPVALLDVKRMAVPNGEYVLEVSFQDVNVEANKKQYTFPLKVDVGSGLFLADLQLLRSFHQDAGSGPFTKNGFYLEPLPFKFYDRAALTLAFYTEIYNSDQVVGDGPKYQVRYYIEEDLGNGRKNLVSTGIQRKKPSKIDAVLVQMDIAKLESGNYELHVEIRTAGNELLTSKSLSFQRSNPFLTLSETEITDDMLKKQFVENLDEKALVFSLRAISPVVPNDDQETLKNVLKSHEIKQMRYFLFRHFARQNPNQPELAYQEYIQLANAVHEKFKSGFRYGFETDRGRTFIRYGKPNDIIHVEDEPSAAPYEIWVYTNFPKTKQQNVKFLFYNPSLAGDDFVLLHSNARGEINNPRWERDLYSRNAPNEFDGPNYQDATQMQRNVNRNARVYFEDF